MFVPKVDRFAVLPGTRLKHAIPCPRNTTFGCGTELLGWFSTAVAHRRWIVARLFVTMPSIWVGGKEYEVKPEKTGGGRVDNVRLGKGVRKTKYMRDRETLREFERRVQEEYAAVQVLALVPCTRLLIHVHPLIHVRVSVLVS